MKCDRPAPGHEGAMVAVPASASPCSCSSSRSTSAQPILPAPPPFCSNPSSHPHLRHHPTSRNCFLTSLGDTDGHSEEDRARVVAQTLALLCRTEARAEDGP